MDHAAARRPLLAAATLTTVGALALTPVAIAPPELHATSVVAGHSSSQAVQLTDAWSTLLNDTVANVVQLGGLFVGANSTFPLPNPIFIAPIAAQLVINPLIYAVQLVIGQGGKIPTEITEHLSNLANFTQLFLSDVPPIIVKQIQTPFIAAQDALDLVVNATNKLAALIEAPALFLNEALNSQYGLIGVNGPIAVPIILRNLLASAISTPVPTIVLPFKKAAGTPSSLRSASAATVATPSGTASSGRSKPKSSSADSKRKASAAKANTKPGGVGRGKR